MSKASASAETAAPDRLYGRDTYMRGLLDQETREVSPALLQGFNDQAIPSTRSTDHYISPVFAAREYERMWNCTWQWACRVEEIPDVGDHVVYEIGETSLIVVRSAADRIQAFHNACLHRGRILRPTGGHVSNFYCPFHGLSWKLDGRLHHFPERWDFGEITDKQMCLPEAKVGLWGGFVFVNLAADPMPLEDYLIDVPEIFQNWAFEDRRLVTQALRTVKANWKVALEAFLETWHSMTTHFENRHCLAHAHAQIDVSRARPHFGRLSVAVGVSNPVLAKPLSEDQVLAALSQGVNTSAAASALPPGVTARMTLADMVRNAMKAMSGRDFTAVSDTEMVDLHTYFLFPNTLIFAGYSVPVAMRFLPSRSDTQECVVDLSVLVLPPKGTGAMPITRHTLGPDDTFEAAKVLVQNVDRGFDQDFVNIPLVQKGMRAKPDRTIRLAGYMESQIRHFHTTLDMYLNGDGPMRPQR